MTPSDSLDPHERRTLERPGTLALTVGAVGVVYGDIGTSPLYAFREALRPAAANGITEAEVLGVASLLIWALILIVTLKYVIFLMRADNGGEGGVLSLYALVRDTPRGAGGLFVLGIVGAALFFGDAIITPAISVLSAVEGVKLVTPVLEPWILPITVAIITALFLVQNRGTGPLARWFGPITVLWFVAMALAGLAEVIAMPAVAFALNPLMALTFLAEHGLVGVVVLGAVFLAVTGAEALYADLGHFGRRPIRLAWFGLVFPALALNYLGQAALVLRTPDALDNPFFLLVPEWIRPGMVALATVATVIASQAVITGAFSMTRQAVQLGLLPRIAIRHTSETETGQIVVPVVNVLLLCGVLVLVVSFGSSGALAAAYGIAVCGTMLVTTALVWFLLRRVWRWSLVAACAVVAPMLFLEAVFFAANLLKVHQGGYAPLLLGAVLVLIMWTWNRGTRQLVDQTRPGAVPLRDFVHRVSTSPPVRVPGAAVFFTSDGEAVPQALLQNLRYNQVLHERIIILTIETPTVPYVPAAERARIEHLSEQVVSVRLRFGFMETPNVNRTLGELRGQGLRIAGMKTLFFLGRRKLVPRADIGMPGWQDRLYILLSSLAADPSDFYRLPRDRVVEIGAQIAV